MAKLTEAEGRVFDALCQILGGEVKASESAALRIAIREGCEKRGLTWPGTEGTKVVEKKSRKR